jgi:hypothetical protein
MVLLSSHRITRVLWYSGTPPLDLSFAYETVTLFGQPFQIVQLLSSMITRFSTPFGIATNGLGSYPFARHYSGNHILFSFPPVNEMFQFTGFPLLHYFVRVIILCLQHSEFPHSEICGSMLIYSSPQLIAVSHVLHRRQMPRHPPYALCSLIFF